MEQKSPTEEKAKGAADVMTSSTSPEHASVAYRSFGKTHGFVTLKPEVSEKLPQG